MKTLEIHGKEFSTLQGFYDSIAKFLKSQNCPWGNNLDSLDEVAGECFNYTDDPLNDITRVVWYDFQKSKSEIQDLMGIEKAIDIIDSIFGSQKKIEYIKL